MSFVDSTKTTMQQTRAWLTMLLMLLYPVLLPTSTLALSMVGSSHQPSAERFAVAPMMGHTNRHYHSFARILTKHAHLYTEMIPATQLAPYATKDPEELRRCLSTHPTLQHLIPTHHSGPTILQLGGSDPQSLAQASSVGIRLGVFDGINLNCGCPSNAVTGEGRNSGCALMRDPSLVASCVEAMSDAIDDDESSVELSIKHRLGARDASTYDAELDRSLPDELSVEECANFIRTVSCNSHVKKFQVHARLGLLGNFDPSQQEKQQQLWTPSSPDTDSTQSQQLAKANHQRLRYKAKQLARRATLQNRSVPPLRPNVVNVLANEIFPDYQFITNGGIQSMDDGHAQLSGTKVMGVMVGRAMINHPCLFSQVDEVLYDKAPNTYRTRGQVLEEYIRYCVSEEERMSHTVPKETERVAALKILRRRLVAVPFTLFVGEDGCDAYQRLIRKLINKKHAMLSAESILLAAISLVPSHVVDKPILEFTSSLEDVKSYKYAKEFTKRCGPLQRAIV